MHIPRMSRQEIQSDLDSSLKRLDVDYVDLYWIHRDDPGTPAEEILLTLEELRQQGKFRYAGFSNWIQSRAEEARVAAERLGIPGFFASQNQWSLARADSAKGDPTWAYIDPSFVEWHAAHGMAAFAYTAQAGGYFRRLERDSLDQAPAPVRDLFHHEENARRFERIQKLAGETGYTITQIVLGYLIYHRFPVFPIVGPKNLGDLDDALSAADIDLTSEQLQFLVPQAQ
jgi:aryl-alcohol dehydrogenase-like predicted oxidoreductase